MSVCFTLVSLSALVSLFSVQPTRTVCSEATMPHSRIHTEPLTEDYTGFLGWTDSVSGQPYVSNARRYVRMPYS